MPHRRGGQGSVPGTCEPLDRPAPQPSPTGGYDRRGRRGGCYNTAMARPAETVPAERPRVVFMGTPEYAIPTLQRLLVDTDVAAVYTQPDRPAGRGRRTRASPVGELAREHGLPLRQPRSLRRDPEAVRSLLELRPDVVVVAAYGLILPPEALRAPRRGCLNVHASLLPRWRGASPVQRAIAAGDRETGCSIMLIDEGLDSGPVLAAERTRIGPAETAGELTARLAVLGAELLARTLPSWLAGRLEPVAQDEGLVTCAPRLVASDGRVDWSADADAVERHVRAMNPWPGAFTWLPDGRRLKILAAAAAERPNGAPGTVAEASGTALVACGRGAVSLVLVQPAGGRAMTGGDLLRGNRSLAGKRLVSRAPEPCGPS